jgi:hypothetical protein
MTNELLPAEQVELERLEGIIERGLRTFIDVGMALKEIQEKRLYKSYGTFERYCQDRWQMGSNYAYKQIAAAKVVSNLCTRVHTSPSSGSVDFEGDKLPLPVTEKETRPLARLEPEAQYRAWVQAVETAPNGKVTAEHVEHVVRQFNVQVLITDNEQPEPVNEEDDLITTERVTIIAWELALGGTVTPQSVSEMTGISTNGAWRMLTKMSRVRPIVEENGCWFRCR